MKTASKPLAASLALGLIVLAVVLVWLASPRPTQRLTLIHTEAFTTGSIYTVMGFVKNDGSDTVRGARVVITLLDDAGVPQATYDGPLEYEPLIADQESGFGVMMKLNPALTRYSVSFKDGSGRTIPHRDARQ